MNLASPPVVSNVAKAQAGARAEPVGDGVEHEQSFQSSQVEVREVNDLDTLARYAADWNELLALTAGASYFHSFDWFETYWRHFRADQRMRVMLVLNAGRLAGVIPLVVACERTRLGRLRSLRYPLHGWGSFYGPIGADARLLLRCAISRVLVTRRDWDLFDLLWVDRDGADQGAHAAAAADRNLTVRATPWIQSAQIELGGGWDAYWASRKSHFRTNVRRDERRLRLQSEITYLRYRPRGAKHADGDPRWDLYDECERLAASSWQGSSSTGTTLSHDSVRAFLRDAHASAAAFGGADVNLLLRADQPLAFAYNYHFDGYVYGLRTGFASSAAGAGTVLQRMMIEDCCRRGDRLIDLGPGSPETKRLWQTRVAVAWRYTHYSSSSPRAQLLRAIHAFKRQ